MSNNLNQTHKRVTEHVYASPMEHSSCWNYNSLEDFASTEKTRLESLINNIKEYLNDKIIIRLDYGPPYSVRCTVWKPLTPEELLAKEKRKASAEKAATKKKEAQQQREIEQLITLQKKYPSVKYVEDEPL